MQKGFDCIKKLHPTAVQSWGGAALYKKIETEFYPISAQHLPTRCDHGALDDQALATYEQLADQYGPLYATRMGVLQWKIGCNGQFRGDGIVEGAETPEYIVLNAVLAGQADSTIVRLKKNLKNISGT